MNYNALYNYIKDVVNNVQPNAKWFHGRRELITNIKPEETVAFCLPFISTGETAYGSVQIAETWEINIIFYKKDSMPSGLNQNDEEAQQAEVVVLAETNAIADKFIRGFNYNTFNEALESSSDKLELISFSKTNAIKDTSHLLTGTVVSMRVEVPDDFDYCTI